MSLTLTGADWLALLTHFLSLSLLAIGGVITTAPDMHRYLVDQQHWLSDAQFSSSIAVAQAAPGPNVLFIALLGWNVGMNAGIGMGGGPLTWVYPLLGVAIAMVGILLPAPPSPSQQRAGAIEIGNCVQFEPSSKAWHPS